MPKLEGCGGGAAGLTCDPCRAVPCADAEVHFTNPHACRGHHCQVPVGYLPGAAPDIGGCGFIISPALNCSLSHQTYSPASTDDGKININGEGEDFYDDDGDESASWLSPDHFGSSTNVSDYFSGFSAAKDHHGSSQTDEHLIHGKHAASKFHGTNGGHHQRIPGPDHLFSTSVAQMPHQLTPMDREARVLKYREKRKSRRFEKTIRYASRKAYAETRPRIKGRFARSSDVNPEVDHYFSTVRTTDGSSYSVVPMY